MNGENILIIGLLVGGTLVMLLALLSTAKILKLLENSEYIRSWRLLYRLMAFFLVGYILALLLVLSGLVGTLAFLSGIIFFFGALFVHQVVRVNLATLNDLLHTTVSKTYVEKIIHSMGDSLVVTGPDLRIETVNQATLRLLGYRDDELLGQPLSTLIPGADEFLKAKKVLESPAPGSIEIAYRKMDDRLLPVSFSGSRMTGKDNQLQGYVCVAQDITIRKEAENRLIHNALHDSLTDLPNRTLLMERLKVAIRQSNRDRQYAVLFIDLDRFKVVNDSLGHPMGDQLLVAVGRRLEDCIRSSDTVARFGGDEFVILLSDISGEPDVLQVAERIIKRLRRAFYLQGERAYVTASIGIVLGDTTVDQPDDILRNADIALYRAKANGRDCHVIFHKSMHATAINRLKLEDELRHALEYEQFRVYFQPIVALRTGDILSFEALVRWQHPTRGLLLPGEFLPVAEETGLIIPIGWWVLKEACRVLCLWQERYPERNRLQVSVNLSANQFSHPELRPHIDRIVEKACLRPGSLNLEITESAIMADTDYAMTMFSSLRKSQVRVQVDDFGTGYSSLGYLQNFPVDVLKIDRSFVERICSDRKNAEIVQTIINLAHELGVTTVAEGVETAEQVERLAELGCDAVQGFFFARPLEAEKIENYLAGVPGMAEFRNLYPYAAERRLPEAA